MSCCQPDLKLGRFTFVVLDECSQMTEPLSLAPLLLAQARWGAGRVGGTGGTRVGVGGG